MRILILLGICILYGKVQSGLASEAEDKDVAAGDQKNVKRSPIAATGIHGITRGQFIIRHGDDAQELSPEYFTVAEQYTNAQDHRQHAGLQEAALVPDHKHVLQNQYHQQRYIDEPRQRPYLAQYALQSEIDREVPQIHPSAQPHPKYHPQPQASHVEPKRGFFEQELLQLVSANQAREFGLLQQQKEHPKQEYQEPDHKVLASIAYYQKPVNALAQAPKHHQPQQYHIETSVPIHPSEIPATYAVNLKQAGYEEPQPHYEQSQAPRYQPPARPHYNAPSAHPVNLHANDAERQAERQAEHHAQLRAEAQALAFQKISQASHLKHQQNALEQIRIAHEHHRQQSAIEQINQGQVSDAGKKHIVESLNPNHEAKYQTRLKAQIVAEERKNQEAAEYKAHADAILALQRQQQAHLKAQEDAYNYALNFEKNQLKAQEEAQALANAQAVALYRAHQSAHQKAQKEAVQAARAQHDARTRDPENTPVIQYLLPNTAPLPEPNAYLVNDQARKYQTSESLVSVQAVPKAALKGYKKKPVKALIYEDVGGHIPVHKPEYLGNYNAPLRSNIIKPNH